MKYVFLITCLLSIFSSDAQNDMAYTRQLTEEFTEKLKERAITDYVVAEHFCSGTIEMFKIDGKMCVTKDTYIQAFVLWKEEGQVFLKKIDNCGLFHSIPLEDESLYEYFGKHGATMAQEKVQRYMNEKSGRRPALRRKVQPCSRTFELVQEGNSSKKGFNLFDISNSSETGENENYEYNQQLKLVEFHTLLEEEVAKHTYKRF